MDVLAIADDATGALETGAKLAECGLQSLVTLDLEADLDVRALVVDAETRHMTADMARDRVRGLIDRAHARGVRHIYKKTDSTLRGNIGAEFQGVLDVLPDYPIIYVPAWPSMGRTVTGGHLFVDGRPVSETAFSQDPRSPVQTSRIDELLAPGCRSAVRHVAEPVALEAILAGGAVGQVVLCDSSTENDLDALASILAGHEQPYIAAGPAGFLAPWIRKLLPSDSPTSAPPDIRSGLVVNGSLHPSSAQQIRVAERAGLPVSRLSLPSYDPALIANLVAALRVGPWACVSASPRVHSEARIVAERLGSVTRAVLNQAEVNAVVVFGGDTTLAILKALETSTVTPCGELQPGVPFSSVRFAGRRLSLVTKAGGFGDADLLVRIEQCQH